MEQGGAAAGGAFTAFAEPTEQAQREAGATEDAGGFAAFEGAVAEGNAFGELSGGGEGGQEEEDDDEFGDFGDFSSQPAAEQWEPQAQPAPSQQPVEPPPPPPDAGLLDLPPAAFRSAVEALLAGLAGPPPASGVAAAAALPTLASLAAAYPRLHPAGEGAALPSGAVSGPLRWQGSPSEARFLQHLVSWRAVRYLRAGWCAVQQLWTAAGGMAWR